MTVVTTLLVLFVLTLTIQSAASTCRTSADLTTCDHVTLKENQPLKLDAKTRKLQLLPPLDELPARLLSNLVHLQGLYVNYTLMLRIDRDALYGLSDLRELDLYWNEITTLPAGVLRHCPRLIYLNLGGNNLAAVEGELAHLKRLRQLILADNALTNVPNLATLERLEWLDLASNRIEIIRSGIFGGLRKLIQLNLRSNRIKTIESNAFDGLTSLQRLNLEWNEISTLDPGNLRNSLPALTEIRITANEFPCEELKRVVDQFAELNVYIPEGLAEPGPITYHGIFCVIPSAA